MNKAIKENKQKASIVKKKAYMRMKLILEI